MPMVIELEVGEPEFYPNLPTLKSVFLEVKSLVVIQHLIKILTPPQKKILTPAHAGCLIHVQLISNVMGNIKIALPKAFEKIQILVQIFPGFCFILSCYHLPYWLL